VSYSHTDSKWLDWLSIFLKPYIKQGRLNVWNDPYIPAAAIDMHDYFIRWQCDRTLLKLHHELYVQAREQAGKEASPTTAIIDSQSVKSAERGARPRIRSSAAPAWRARCRRPRRG
jgi:hypothetical protein